MKNADLTPRTRRVRAANVLFVAADALLVLGVLAGVWWWYLNRVPELNVPAAPPLPNPNGYDRLAAVGKQIVREKEVGFAIASTPELQQKELGHVVSPGDQEQLIADNAETLAAVREALTLPVQAPPFKTFTQTFPEFAKMRGLARLLSLEEKVNEAKGDVSAAAGSSLDAMQMGSEIPNGGALIARLVGIACEAIGRRPLLPLADRMSASEARTAASRLEAMQASRVPLAKTFEAEKWGTQSSLQDIFRKQNIVAAAMGMADSSSGEGDHSPFSERIGIALSALRTPKTQVLANHARYMDAIIAQVGQPYDPHPVMPAEPSDAINRAITPVFTQARHKETDTETQNALLLGKLALRAYHEEHGDYPESLSELVSGGYLKAAPADPFARNAQDPLRYRRVSGSEYVLYSVGPDGTDDGGRPFAPQTENQRWTLPDTQGDFVLGVNLY